MPVNESNTIQYTVVTSRVADGTTLYWKTTGNTTNSDIVGGNTGSITVTNNRAVFNVTITADSSTDGTKELGINLLTGSLNGTSVATTPTPIVVNDTSRAPVSFSADYLVLGGGGGGGAYSSPAWSGYPAGGGGAGGYRAGTISLTSGNTYTIVVGAGGSSSPNLVGNGSNGSQSSFDTVTANGGGGGGYAGPVGGQGNAGNPGASGGGGGRGQPGGSATNFPGPLAQGFPGGPGVPANFGAGGGGAGGVGSPGATNPAPGGIGLSNSITGSPVVYATGGPGGPGSAGGNGTGDGGSAFNPGGPGAVILSIPTPNYPGSAPGATVTTPPAAPGKTILTFTSSGTYTA